MGPDTKSWSPSSALTGTSPRRSQDPGLRCSSSRDACYPIRSYWPRCGMQVSGTDLGTIIRQHPPMSAGAQAIVTHLATRSPANRCYVDGRCRRLTLTLKR
jgi:hypothetical protein